MMMGGPQQREKEKYLAECGEQIIIRDGALGKVRGDLKLTRLYANNGRRPSQSLH